MGSVPSLLWLRSGQFLAENKTKRKQDRNIQVMAFTKAQFRPRALQYALLNDERRRCGTQSLVMQKACIRTSFFNARCHDMADSITNRSKLETSRRRYDRASNRHALGNRIFKCGNKNPTLKRSRRVDDAAHAGMVGNRRFAHLARSDRQEFRK